MRGFFDGRRKRMEEEREIRTTAKAKTKCGGSSPSARSTRSGSK
jgi:hypothetical protein